MKTTSSTQNDLQLTELSKSHLILIKTMIGVFTVVLNVCCFQLFF